MWQIISTSKPRAANEQRRNRELPSQSDGKNFIQGRLLILFAIKKGHRHGGLLLRLMVMATGRGPRVSAVLVCRRRDAYRRQAARLLHQLRGARQT
jgi:hypothetical protein